MKTCNKCGIEKPLEDFGKYSRSKDGKAYRCRTCYNSYMRDFYKKNPEAIKERAHSYFVANREVQNEKRRNRRIANLEAERETGRKWAAKNADKTRTYKSKYNAKRRQVIRNGNLSVKDAQSLFKQTECFYCREKTKLTLDHVVPLAKGGAHSIGNLVMACRSCNSSKNDKLLVEWKLYLAKVSNDRT